MEEAPTTGAHHADPLTGSGLSLPILGGGVLKLF